MLRDELADLFETAACEAFAGEWKGQVSGKKWADRIISLLDKQVQEAGWVVSVDVTRALERDEGVTRPATLEELLNNKAHRTGGG
jgi:hypothetical protein